MNWYKISQSQEVAVAIYSMLIKARDNPVMPIDVSLRLNGQLPDTISQGLNNAYPRALRDSGGSLSEAQQRVLFDIQSLINNLTVNKPENSFEPGLTSNQVSHSTTNLEQDSSPVKDNSSLVV